MTPTTKKRSRPLSVEEPSGNGTGVVDAVAPLEAPPYRTNGSEGHTEERAARFAEDVRTLRIGRTSVVLGERILLVLGGILAPLGIAVVLLGWWGASNTSYDFEQIPYLISGGILGLALVFVGCFLYFAHWITTLVKEHREQSAAILAALERLIDQQDGRTP